MPLARFQTHGIDMNLLLWPRGVESDLFNPGRRSLEWRSARGILESDIVVLFVSRLVTEKGLDVVIDVIRKAAASVTQG